MSSYPSTPSPVIGKPGRPFDKASAKKMTRGEVRFPPYITDNREIMKKQRELQMGPPEEIQFYAKHIPYSSEKKTFLSRTGRESFEVFHYGFVPVGDDKEHTVMWDYNIGLVRITSLFKGCKYSKTTPSKMINQNPGLREIVHSITGGALVAQGYWMPFEAAKSLASTFCWPIRWALTPLFGDDFPYTCNLPADPAYGRMVIDKELIRRCAAQARRFRQAQDPSTRPLGPLPIADIRALPNRLYVKLPLPEPEPVGQWRTVNSRRQIKRARYEEGADEEDERMRVAAERRMRIEEAQREMLMNRLPPIKSLVEKPQRAFRAADLPPTPVSAKSRTLPGTPAFPSGMHRAKRHFSELSTDEEREAEEKKKAVVSISSDSSVAPLVPSGSASSIGSASSYVPSSAGSGEGRRGRVAMVLGEQQRRKDSLPKWTEDERAAHILLQLRFGGIAIKEVATKKRRRFSEPEKEDEGWQAQE